MRTGIATLLFAACIALAVLQTPWSRQRLERWLVERAREQGIALTLSPIRGFLPFSLKCTEVRVANVPLHTLRIHLALLPWHLRVRIKRCTLANHSIPLDLRAKLLLSRSQITLQATSPLFCASGHLRGALEGRVALFSSMGGQSFAGLTWNAKEACLSFDAEACKGFGVPLDTIRGTLRVSRNGKGALHVRAHAYQLPFELTSDLALESSQLLLDRFILSVADAQCRGNLRVRLPLQSTEADLTLCVPDVSSLQPLFPTTPLQGTLTARLQTGPSPSLALSGRELRVGSICATELQVEGNLAEIRGEATGVVRGELSLASVHFETMCTSTRNPFLLDAKGAYRSPFRLQATGSWTCEGSEPLEGSANLLYASDATKGSLQMHLTHKTMQLHACLYGAHTLDLSATLPLTHALYPWQMHIDPHSPLVCEMSVDTPAQALFDLLTPGSQAAGGQLRGHLLCTHNWAHPSLYGAIEWTGGSYEAFTSGLQLRAIQGRLSAMGQPSMTLQIQALDDAEGSFLATGEVMLTPSQLWLQAQLHNVHALHSDLIDLSVSGPLRLQIDRMGARVQGDLCAAKAQLTLPDRLPSEMPSLAVTFVNPPPQLQRHPAPPPHRMPVQWDVSLRSPVDTSGNVVLRGKGISSEWEGELKLKQPLQHATGSLTLTKGEYRLGSRNFTLMEGEIRCNGKSLDTAYLNLSGVLALEELTITATLCGPLNAPQLTFQSVPKLPTSSLMARILFDKDISQISTLQAIQLAHAIFNLSGRGSSDLFDRVKKNLGIDALNVTAPTQDVRQTALEVGWALAHGVMVTLSQSMATSQVTVDLDLPYGLLLQAQTNVHKEGKFSLKWHRND